MRVTNIFKYICVLIYGKQMS